MKMLCPKCQQEFTVKRSLAQNRYFYKILSIIQNHTSNYSVNQLKVLFKKEYGYYEEFVNQETGAVEIEYKSTADLSMKDFALLTEQIRMFAEVNGVTIFTPQEWFEGNCAET